MKKIIIGLIALILIVIPLNAANTSTNFDIINLNADTYNYSPTPVISGDEFEIWIQLTNKSNVGAENVEYYLETEYPFVLITENQGIINKLDAYQSKIIKYKLKTNSDTLTGTYDLEFRYKREGVNIYNIKKYKIDIKGKNAIIEMIDSEIENIKIGADSKIYLNLKNLGQKNSQNIFITLNDSSDETIKVIGLKTQYLEGMAIGEEKKISFLVNVSKNISKTSYTLPITINYSDVDRDYSISRSIGIKLADEPKLFLNVLNIGNNFKIKQNSEEKLSLEVYNTGNVDTEVAYLTVTGENIVSTQEFIGSIEKDNYDKLDIIIKTKEIKDKETTIVISLFYKDSSLQEQKISQTFVVSTDNITDKSNANKIIFSVFGIIGLIVGLALFILIARWLIKILIKPAYHILINLFRRK